MKLEERAEEKRKELTDIVKGVIQNYDIQNKEEISSGIINHFLKITPPEMELRMELIIIRQGGVGGGRSTKPGNIWLNWRKLLVEGSESILTVAGAIAVPWLIPLAGLVVWNKICSMLTIEITERHAVVIWTMWLNKDSENCIKGDVILNLVNKELSKYNRPKMNRRELHRILKDLKEMKCIEEEGNKWWLREWVKVFYE
ncbi:MAG: hypothetical protein H5T45_06200 [Thermoplasmatales archaeon]|nr:hypothetical protein [Thermoplasmatales archaeon]